MTRWLQILADAGKKWNADNVFKHSAAVSFYTLFSLAPVTLIAVTMAGIFLGREEASRQLGRQLAELVGPASTDMIQAAAKASLRESDSRFAMAAGIVLLFVGATSVFGQLQSSLNAIWGVRTRPSRSGWVFLILQRLISFGMVLIVGFLLLVSLVLTTMLASALGRFQEGWLASPVLLWFADLLVGLAVVTVLFALLFKVLPDVRLRWRDVWLGAFVTALLFTAGRSLIALYLSHSTVASIYGTAGSLVAVLVWVYYSCAILFYGVEFTRAYRQAHRVEIKAKKTAVVVE